MLIWWTDLADQAVILPACGVVALFLLRSGWSRGTACWTGLVLGVLGVMLLLKLVAGVYDIAPPQLMLLSPSGHTASSAMLYGGLAAMLLPRLGPSGSGLLALAIAGLFATSRVVLGVHSIADVIVGGCVGSAGVVLFRRAVGRAPASLHRGWLLSCVLAVVLLAHGHRLPAEQQIHALAMRLRAMAHPMDRMPPGVER